MVLDRLTNDGTYIKTMNPKFCFDFHVHSSYSMDSLLSPMLIIKLAHLKGLDAIAITDHNTIEGAVSARSVKQDNIMIIIGSEINTDYGDLIGIFLNEEIKSRSFNEVIDEIKEQDGIVILPHPYRRKNFPNDGLLKRVDIIESINARTSEKFNLDAQMLAKELKKPMIAGSDAHFSFELGRVCNSITNISDYNEEELRKKILTEDISICSKSYSLYIYKISIILGTIIKKVRSNSIYI